MEGPVQNPRRDRGNELRTEASTRHRQASGTSDRKSMLCGGMQADSLQHKEVGQGPLDPGEAITKLRWFCVPYFEAVLGRPEQNPVFSKSKYVLCGLSDDIVKKRHLLLRNQNLTP